MVMRKKKQKTTPEVGRKRCERVRNKIITSNCTQRKEGVEIIEKKKKEIIQLVIMIMMITI